MRLKLYALCSVLSAAAVIVRAFGERPNFYSAAVLISSSNGSLMVLANLSLLAFFTFVYGMQRVFYGPLRPIEVEHLYERTWLAVTETLLAMTIFRDDFGVWFFVMFLCLLAARLWEWIGEGRVEFLEQQPPANPRLFHSRLSTSLVLGVLFDCFMFQSCLSTLLREARPGMMVMFAFEFALLAITSTSTLIRYALSVGEILVIRRQTAARLEARRAERRAAMEPTAAVGDQTIYGSSDAEQIGIEDDGADEDDLDVPGWEERGRWIFVLDLVTDFIKSVVYCGFFVILLAFHGLPIHIMRDLFFTIRSFCKRVHDFIQYRNATRDMNARYPDATEEEIGRENTCIVCRDEMEVWSGPNAEAGGASLRVDEKRRPKKLPCGHILHLGCLRSWLERQQTCPTCRRSVLSEDLGLGSPETNPANQQARAFPALNIPGVQARQPDHENPQGNLRGAPQNDGQLRQNPHHRQGLRVLNFGPIRIAYGAAPAAQAQNILNELQLGPQVAPPQANPTNLTQYLQGVDLSTNNGPDMLQMHIQRIQTLVVQEISRLQNQQSQLDHVYLLLAELYRLQQEQDMPETAGTAQPSVHALSSNSNMANTGSSRPTSSASAHDQNPPLLRRPLNTSVFTGPPNSVLPQAYTTIPNHIPMASDVTDLPEGLRVPDGYTLQRLVRAPVSQGNASFAISSTITSPAQSIRHPLADQRPDSSAAGSPQLREHPMVTVENAEDDL